MTKCDYWDLGCLKDATHEIEWPPRPSNMFCCGHSTIEVCDDHLREQQAREGFNGIVTKLEAVPSGN